MGRNKLLGKFIVFEGLDGAGGETQTNLLLDFFKKEKIPAEKLTYPDYEGPIGGLIHEFLHKKYEFSPENQFLLYFSDFLKDKKKIEQWQKEKKVIITDRYFTSTLAYQCQQGFPIESALKITDIFGLPRPDLVIYLKISPETSIERKFEEKQSLDRHEADKEFLGKLCHTYGRLIEKQIFSPWAVVDGEEAINEVFEQIKNIINNELL